MWLFLLSIWRKLSWQPKLILLVFLFVGLLFAAEYVRNRFEESTLQNQIKQGQEANATKSAQAVNRHEATIANIEANINATTTFSYNGLSNDDLRDKLIKEARKNDK